jgi:2-dehydro-3-deoxygluconokinase
MPYDVITLGEPLLRLTPPRYRPLDHAEALDVEVGGSEANTAAGLAGLGIKTAYWTRLTDNPLGRMIARTVAEYGVDTSAITWTEKDRIGTYYYEDAAAPRQPRVIYDRAGSAASKMRPSDLPAGFFAEGNAKWLHLTGITPALSYAANGTALHALKQAEEANWRISFDVNFRSRLWTSTEAQLGVEPFLRTADLAFIPLRDARLLYGITMGTPVERVLDTLAAYYPQATWVMTMGADGALARDRDGTMWRQKSYNAHTISRIGSGDAFDAGFMAAYIRGAPLPEALRWGCAAAAIKRSIPGDLARLTEEDIKRVITEGMHDVER